MIKLKNIKKLYGDKVVVSINSLELDKGRIYVLLGPNGAGKTTTIRMLLGLLKPSEGSVEIDGFEVLKNVDIKRQIGYVSDVPNLYENLTGYEHIEFIANLYNCYDRERINSLITLFDMYENKDKLISTYSKGMKQKISVISSLVYNPKILILDEPFTGLDPITIKVFKEYLAEFIRDGSNLVLFSTHDLDVASNVCTDAVIMNKGKIVASFNDKEIKKSGLDKLFFKEINILEG